MEPGDYVKREIRAKILEVLPDNKVWVEIDHSGVKYREVWDKSTEYSTVNKSGNGSHGLKRNKKDELDRFYTNPDVSKKLTEKVFEILDEKDYNIFLEPSAGSGSFLQWLPPEKRLGLDLAPASDEIIEQDFFKFKHEEGKKYLVIGNPPFGRACSLAYRFFNHAAEFADAIAFLIPRTFRRVSIQNKLNLNFHLIYDEQVPLKPCSFTPPMGAKCCFQIWVRKSEKRKKIILPKKHVDWEFLPFGPNDANNQPTPPDGASFAMKAYGSNCGEIKVEGLEELRPKSWHWIKCKNPKNLIDKFSKLDYNISKDSTRQDSLGRADLVFLYNREYRREEGETE